MRIRTIATYPIAGCEGRREGSARAELRGLRVIARWAERASRTWLPYQQVTCSRSGSLRDGFIQRARSPAAFGALLLLALIAIALFALVAHNPAAIWQLDQPHRELVREALVVSLESTFASAIAIIIMGTPLALLLTRRFPGREWLEAFITLPVVLPPVVAGLALLLALGRRGLLGHALGVAGIHISFSTARRRHGADARQAAPLYVIAAKNAFERTDPRLIDAAATLRASFTYTAFRVIIPPALPALGSGACVGVGARARRNSVRPSRLRAICPA